MKKMKQQIDAMISREEKELEKRRTTRHNNFEESIYLSGYIAGLNRGLMFIKEFNLKATKDEAN